MKKDGIIVQYLRPRQLTEMWWNRKFSNILYNKSSLSLNFFRD